MENYYNSLSRKDQLLQLGKCDFMDSSEFVNGVEKLKNKKIVIVGCGAQGLNQGLNMRDSGLNVSYALRKEAIDTKRQSYLNTAENKFEVGTYEEMIPAADLVINLTPDKQHTDVVNKVMPLMKRGATLSYSHGFNIVEEGMKVREDLTVVMMAPKSPGSEVREEYKRGFGVPTLIAVHPENNPNGDGLEIAKAYAVATGGHRAGVLNSSFVAEVKSDLMGEQTILCGVLQTGSILYFDKMIENGMDSGYAAKLVQYGWEAITEELKHGGVTQMMNRLDDASKVKTCELANELKTLMTPLFEKHMKDVLSGDFSLMMMKDWVNNDKQLLTWRAETGESAFEKATEMQENISNQEFFDNGLLMVAFTKAGVELAYETMVKNGIKAESAYYESLHEAPLIANTIARKKLYEMNRVISDTAEYGCYLFNHACIPLLSDFMLTVETNVIGESFSNQDEVNSTRLKDVDDEVENHPIEQVGARLRESMTAMQKLEVPAV
jgi:ketol-acid reductoisomerase